VGLNCHWMLNLCEDPPFLNIYEILVDLAMHFSIPYYETCKISETQMKDEKTDEYLCSCLIEYVNDSCDGGWVG